jgi:hypothetical protein
MYSVRPAIRRFNEYFPWLSRSRTECCVGAQIQGCIAYSSFTFPNANIKIKTQQITSAAFFWETHKQSTSGIPPNSPLLGDPQTVHFWETPKQSTSGRSPNSPLLGDPQTVHFWETPQQSTHKGAPIKPNSVRPKTDHFWEPPNSPLLGDPQTVHFWETPKQSTSGRPQTVHFWETPKQSTSGRPPNSPLPFTSFSSLSKALPVQPVYTRRASRHLLEKFITFFSLPVFLQ